MKNLKLILLFIIWNYGFTIFLSLAFFFFLYHIYDMLTAYQMIGYSHIAFISPEADKYIVIAAGSNYLRVKVQRKCNYIKAKLIKPS